MMKKQHETVDLDDPRAFHWWRAFHGMASHPLWRLMAKRSGQPPALVLSVVIWLMEHASKNKGQRRGTIEGFDPDTCAEYLGVEPADIEAVLTALRTSRVGKGAWLEGDLIASWHERQPRREDSSAKERSRRYRERKASQTSPGVTQRHAASPGETRQHPVQPGVTLEESRVEERREDTEERQVLISNSVDSIKGDFQEKERAAPPAPDLEWDQHQKGSTPEQIAASAKAHGLLHFVIAGSEPWKEWMAYRALQGLKGCPTTAHTMEDGKTKLGWWFPKLRPPKKPPAKSIPVQPTPKAVQATPAPPQGVSRMDKKPPVRVDYVPVGNGHDRDVFVIEGDGALSKPKKGVVTEETLYDEGLNTVMNVCRVKPVIARGKIDKWEKLVSKATLAEIIERSKAVTGEFPEVWIVNQIEEARKTEGESR